MKPFQPKLRWVWTICLLSGLLFLFLYVYRFELWSKVLPLYDFLYDHHKIKAFINSFGPYSPLAYILLQIVQVIVAPIPGGAVEFLGGYLFGVRAGFLYSMIGLALGSWAAFSLARVFEKWALEKFIPQETRKKFDYLIEHEAVMLSLLLFLIPGFPKDALCYILGLTPMHVGIFLAISTVGRVPGTLMACLQGGKAFDHQYKTLLILLGISSLVILAFYVYHEEVHRFLKRIKG